MSASEEQVTQAADETVEISPYDPAWPELFAAERDHLRACLPTKIIGRIEHFGSTAVPGLAAKPIIDMLVEVRSLSEVRDTIAPVLEAQGYTFLWRPSWKDGVTPEYTWFIKRDVNGRRSHHIHMLTPGSTEWERLLFRDYLRTHPETAHEYGQLKQRIAQGSGNRRAYAEAKGDFINSVTAKAHHWKAQATRHNAFEDAQALLIGSLLVALSVVFLRHAGLLTGGTAGIALLAHYATGLAFGLVYFVISIPFYLLAVRAMGWAFTLKTFVAVALLSVYSEWLPRLIVIGELDPVFAAVMGGLLAGIGLLMLFRHQASLGGIGIVALVLQRRKGWRAGNIQMAADGLILAAALFHVSPLLVLLSILGAGALNLVIAINHKPGRYFGT